MKESAENTGCLTTLTLELCSGRCGERMDSLSGFVSGVGSDCLLVTLEAASQDSFRGVSGAVCMKRILAGTKMDYCMGESASRLSHSHDRAHFAKCQRLPKVRQRRHSE